MNAFSTMFRWTLLAGLMFGIMLGCGDDQLTPTSQPLGAPRMGSPLKKKAPKKSKKSKNIKEEEHEEDVEEAPSSESRQKTFDDDDFVEVEIENRDPFRSFANSFRSEDVTIAQRKVLMGM